ncbi:MMPL family transporter [Phytoactinopolyspora sp. XMNu-373]|uniref:MMPL family transporter n=2 Tax=Phytoactinopolyspora mesophila TaxID=2650750 RepID=A0A7K3MAF3_9ACTN|nr:MMPL family transporter [Phytoactinopolyspora mesophila]
MLARLAALVMRRRRAVLVTVVMLALIGGASGSTLFDRLSAGGWNDPNAESGQAADILEDVFGQGQPNLVLLVSSPDGVDEPAAASAGTRLSERLAAEPGVGDVASYWLSGQAPQMRNADGDKALILANIEGDATTVDNRLVDLIADYGGDWDGLHIQIGGYAMFEHELTEQSERDIIKAELLVFPVTMLALVLIFGSVVAATLPLAVAMVTVLLGMGVMWVLADVTSLSVLAVNVVTLLGLGLAIDYSLLMVNRYREELRGGRGVAEAISMTMRTAGRTVVFSAVTVAIALSVLAWFPLAALRSVSYAGIATALLAGFASLTVLPALFAVLGHRVDRGRVFRRRARRRGEPDGEQAVENGFWHRLATVVMRRPLPIASIVAVFLLLLGAPFLNLKLGEVDERTMPESAESRQVATAIRTEFGSGEQNALQVVMPEATSDAGVIAGYGAELSGFDGVARVDTATGSYVGGGEAVPAGPMHEQFARGDAVYFSVVPAAGEPEDAQRLVDEIRAAPAPFQTLVGGQPAITVDGNDALTTWLPYSLATLAVVMVILLFLLTGSVVLPFLAMALSLLSLTATFGALVWIFQEGNLSGLLGFTVTGSLPGTVPVMLFAVAFGLAMDYQVFMLSRIREEYERTGENTRAVALGLERIGRIVTAAAVLISIVFLAFLISDITLMKAFGLGLPLAVLLDATLVRGALLPASMKLLGRATWWAPAPLRRFHARFGLREGDPVTSSPLRRTG